MHTSSGTGISTRKVGVCRALCTVSPTAITAL
jgi:hypothetical protein